LRPETVFENIYNLMRYGTTITNISEAGGVSTITTSEIYTLEDGMLVEISSKIYQISNLTRTGVAEYTFDVKTTGLSASTWQLALYYEYGRAVEVGNTQHEKKEDPTNKNLRWPLMWLLTDIEKTNTDLGYTANIIVAFIYVSEQNLKAKQRVESNYEPILDPLVELFKSTLTNSPGNRYFTLEYGERKEFDTTDKFKYGSIEGNKHLFRDITDAIQINVDLNFRQSECLPIYTPSSGIGSAFIVS